MFQVILPQSTAFFTKERQLRRAAAAQCVCGPRQLHAAQIPRGFTRGVDIVEREFTNFTVRRNVKTELFSVLSASIGIPKIPKTEPESCSTAEM